MGMSRKDFELCTPLEFRAIWDKWSAHEELMERAAWERTRWLMLAEMQPHTKRELQVRDVLKLPWDEQPDPGRQREQEGATAGDMGERYEKAKEKYGLK